MAPVQHKADQPRSGTADRKEKDRKYFHKVEPTFFAKSATTQLEFVDNSDPSKAVVVRKKAREWVHRNRETTKGMNHTFSISATREAESAVEPPRLSRPSPVTSSLACFDPSAGRIDPFDCFPDVGRRVDHIIEYFLTQCPEEVPCSDDKYAWRAPRSDLRPSRDNSVLGMMATEHVSFVLWLHATTLIRDGSRGNWQSEEGRFYYNQALQVMKKEIQRKVEDYTDSFICALACFTAIASFSGQYKAAELHRDAMVKALTLKGFGDLAVGLQRCGPFTQKATAWCEIHVAAQIPALPKLPYSPPVGESLPYAILAEAERLRNATLSNLWPLQHPFPEIIVQLHQLSLSQSQLLFPSHIWPGLHKIDPSVIRPLYCVEYSLLQVLSVQQRDDHDFTILEVILSEACQLYFWIAIRALGPQMKMCDLFVARLKKALLPLLDEMPRKGNEASASSLASYDATMAQEQYSIMLGDVSPSLSIIKLDFVLIWALFLGTLVSSVGPRPEHNWYKEQLLQQMFIKNPGLFKSQDDLKRVLKIFPYTEVFCGLGIPILHLPFEVKR